MLVAFETVAVFAQSKTSPLTEWPRFSQASVQLLHCSLWLLEPEEVEDTKTNTNENSKYIELTIPSTLN